MGERERRLNRAGRERNISVRNRQGLYSGGEKVGERVNMETVWSTDGQGEEKASRCVRMCACAIWLQWCTLRASLPFSWRDILSRQIIKSKHMQNHG